MPLTDKTPSGVETHGSRTSTYEWTDELVLQSVGDGVRLWIGRKPKAGESSVLASLGTGAGMTLTADDARHVARLLNEAAETLTIPARDHAGAGE